MFQIQIKYRNDQIQTKYRNAYFVFQVNMCSNLVIYLTYAYAILLHFIKDNAKEQNN